MTTFGTVGVPGTQATGTFYVTSSGIDASTKTTALLVA
jgi:hypothetical protein